jgi:predicted  nucleic acid-binding Zn-ribbon protein
MEQITLRLRAETLEEVEAEAAEHDRSRSEHLRDVIDSRNEPAAEVKDLRADRDRLRDEVAELEAEVERLEADLGGAESRIDELTDKLAATHRRIDATNDLVAVAESDLSVRERKQRAGILTRARWWLTGMDDDGES